MTELATTGTAEQATGEYARLIRQGTELLNEADALMIRTALGAVAAEHRRQVDELEDQIRQAEPELATARAERDRLAAELDECLTRANSVQAATANDDLTTRITARSLRLAFEEEGTALRARLDGAEAVIRQQEDAIGRAVAETGMHTAELAELAEASADPFRHPRAQATTAYSWRVWSGRTMPLLSLGATTDPEYDGAFSYMLHLVKATGFGASHERRVEEGIKDRYADVHVNAAGVPFVYRAPSPEQVQRRSGGKPIPPPSGPEMGLDLAVARQPGIPGVSPSDAAMI